VADGYACIVLDPPWAEYGGGGRGAQNHYSLMERTAIAKTIIRSGEFRPATNAHLWCWVTDNFLLDGLSLIEQLGFRYVRTFCWTKLSDKELGPLIVGDTAVTVSSNALQIGLGKYARGSHELCLFATRGAAVVPDPSLRPPSVLFAPRREHSRKPDRCFTEWFEKVSPGPRLEMFARSPREGWDVWGNQVEKFSPHTAASGG
jgi:N6-adenosine-specific RNA methylase IME4